MLEVMDLYFPLMIAQKWMRPYIELYSKIFRCSGNSAYQYR